MLRARLSERCLLLLALPLHMLHTGSLGFLPQNNRERAKEEARQPEATATKNETDRPRIMTQTAVANAHRGETAAARLPEIPQGMTVRADLRDVRNPPNSIIIRPPSWTNNPFNNTSDKLDPNST